MIRSSAIVGLLAAALALSLAGCSADPIGYKDCVAAFSEAQSRAPHTPPYETSTLDDAIRECESYAEWRAAWQAVPGSHPEGADVHGFLSDRCTDPSVDDTALCVEVAGT